MTDANTYVAEADPRAVTDRLEAAREQLRRQHAKKQVTLRFALRVRQRCASRRMGFDFGERHYLYQRPRNCARQVIVLAYQTLHRRAPAPATARACPGGDAGGKSGAAPKILGGHLPTARSDGRSEGGAVTPDGEKNSSQTAGQRHNGHIPAAPAGDVCGPASERFSLWRWP